MSGRWSFVGTSESALRLLAAAALLLTIAGPAYAKLPEPQTANVDGIRVLTQRSGGGLAAACVFVGVGAADEDASRNGITSLLNNMVVSASPFAVTGSPVLEIEGLGGTIAVETRSDYSVYSVVVPAGKLGASLKALGAVLAKPPLDGPTLTAEKRNLDNASGLGSDAPVELGYRLLLKNAYPEFACSFTPDGTPETIRNISLEDLADWHGRYFNRENMVVSVCANTDTDDALRAVREGFRPVSAGQRKEPKRRAADKADNKAPADGICEGKAISSSVALVGYKAPQPGSADYPAFRLAEAVLALGMGSKLFSSLRVDDRLSYSFGSIMPPTISGPRLALYVNADPARIDDAVDRVVGAVEAVKQGEFTDAELERARGRAIGALRLDTDGVAARAHRMGLAVSLGLDPAYWDSLADRLRGISSTDVAKIAGKYMGSHTLVLISPGDGG